MCLTKEITVKFLLLRFLYSSDGEFEIFVLSFSSDNYFCVAFKLRSVSKTLLNI